jgi:hypothetical protein
MASEGVEKCVEESSNKTIKEGEKQEIKEKKHRGIPEAGFLVGLYPLLFLVWVIFVVFECGFLFIIAVSALYLVVGSVTRLYLVSCQCLA